MTDQLIQLFQEMADLTRPKCGACRVPLSCCSPEYCGMAADIMAEDGVMLKETGHPTLPFLGKAGCIVAPHYRPLCTIHVCERHYLIDQGFSETYFDLRGRISAAYSSID